MNLRKHKIVLIHLVKNYLFDAQYGMSFIQSFHVESAGKPSPAKSRLSRGLSKVRAQGQWLCGGRAPRAKETGKGQGLFGEWWGVSGLEQRRGTINLLKEFQFSTWIWPLNPQLFSWKNFTEKQNSVSNVAKRRAQGGCALHTETELGFLVDHVWERAVQEAKAQRKEGKKSKKWDENASMNPAWHQVVIWSSLFVQTKCLEQGACYLYISS